MSKVIIEKVIGDIIKKQLDLPDYYAPVSTSKTQDQVPSIFISSQNIKLFYTDKLQVIIKSVDSPKVIASDNTIDYSTTPVTELQQVVMLENIQVDLMSRNNDARDRRYEVITALRSYYAKQAQDQYQFRLFEHSFSFVNTGAAEGGSELNRWTMVFPVHVIYNKIVNIASYDYYNDFKQTYDTEISISDVMHPSFSFEIDISGIH